METSSRYYFTPVKKKGEHSAVARIRAPLSKGVYAWPDYAGRGRSIKPSELKPNDWICFYAGNKVGVVAHAKVSKRAERKSDRNPCAVPYHSPREFPWVFGVSDCRFYFDSPIKVNDARCSQLEKYRKWRGLVQATTKMSRHDFLILTRSEEVETQSHYYKFTVVIEQDEDGLYVASVPLLHGCYTQGETHEEALENIKDAIKLHIEARQALGEPIPIEVAIDEVRVVA